jgi:GWxTD domain-containing protein
MKSYLNLFPFRILLFVFFLILKAEIIHPQNNSGKNKSYLFEKGMEAFKDKDTLAAEKYFKESVEKFDDAESKYQLGLINLDKNTFESRNRAYEFFRKAVLSEPQNIEYRLAFASLMRDFARKSSEDEFKKIILLDSANFNAWLNLAEIKDEDFTEYNNSVRKMSDEFFGSLQEYADKDFAEAEKFYLNALSIDSTNNSTGIKLALLYEKAGKPEKGIPLLEKFISQKKDDKQTHICLGLLFYKTQDLKGCFTEYKKALSMMGDEEKNDFTFNSVKFLIEPAFENAVDSLNEYQLKNFIDIYWKVNDPLYLTEYNERLLEHYSRVAFANLHFGGKKIKKPGWKTDRGEAVLRYGEPLSFMRIRPSMEADGLNMKTEVWSYKNMVLGFTDMALSGNYQFSAPDAPKAKMHTQFAGDTQFFVENLKKVRHTYYDPKFEGPNFDVKYSIAQFKSEEIRNHTDLYVNYKLQLPDSLYKPDLSSLKFNTGLFFFNKNYDEQFRYLKTFEISKAAGDSVLKSLITTARPDSGFISFEIIREKDKGTFSDRSKFRVRKFNSVRLDISDLLAANYAGTDSLKNILLNRKRIKIIPSADLIFGKNNQPYLYYEIYNLKKGENGLTDFEQRVTIMEYKEKPVKGFEAAAKSFLEFLGIGRKSEVTLTNKYKTPESDPQIYFQLDLEDYEPGKYEVIVNVKDLIQNTEAVTRSVIDWRN